ncbi:MAG: Urmylation protein [Geoglossum simile]|nr:MAG: Urmylation protein [Geoglossum simile]
MADDDGNSAARLRSRIVDLEGELARLKLDLVAAERENGPDRKPEDGKGSNSGNSNNNNSSSSSSRNRTGNLPLSLEEYKRYGRQMVMPEIGLQGTCSYSPPLITQKNRKEQKITAMTPTIGQLLLKKSSVLIIGLGGLGCPAATYLAGAGVGTIGLVDGDVVETSNLHRQIAHSTERLGWGKVESAVEYLRGLNPLPTYITHPAPLTPQTALPLLTPYDLILDCTDHPTTRYLISDACVLLSKPLVTAAALRAEGQLMVLNNPPLPPGDADGGPCYRCVFPQPPAPETLVSCGEGGVLGPVVGVMGVLMAGETVKLLAIEAQKEQQQKKQTPSLHLFSPLIQTPFRTIRLRSRRTNCAVCSSSATITRAALLTNTFSYTAFCGHRPAATTTTNILHANERISAQEYNAILSRQPPDTLPHSLIDTREPPHFQLCSLPNSINIPISLFHSPDWLPPSSLPAASPIYVICQHGNDSQLAVRRLKDAGLDRGGKRFIGDIRGGLRAWREEIDEEWPEY